MIIDITNRRGKLKDVQSWLVENVGQYYGTDWNERKYGIGSGWEIYMEAESDELGQHSTKILLDITDDEKALHFVLLWV